MRGAGGTLKNVLSQSKSLKIFIITWAGHKYFVSISSIKSDFHRSTEISTVAISS